MAKPSIQHPPANDTPIRTDPDKGLASMSGIIGGLILFIQRRATSRTIESVTLFIAESIHTPPRKNPPTTSIPIATHNSKHYTENVHIHASWISQSLAVSPCGELEVMKNVNWARLVVLHARLPVIPRHTAFPPLGAPHPLLPFNSFGNLHRHREGCYSSPISTTSPWTSWRCAPTSESCA